MNNYKHHSFYFISILFINIYLCLLKPANSSNILFLSPISAKSENILYTNIIQGLVSKGHNVTFISSVNSSKLPSNSVRQIKILEAEEIYSVFSNALEYRSYLKSSIINRVALDFNFILEACHRIYQNPKFSQFIQEIKRENRKFHLVLIADITCDCFAGILPLINAPYIYVSPITPANFQTLKFGNYLPPSYHPSPLLPFGSKMTFYERLVNSILDTIGLVFFSQEVNPKFESIYKQYLGDNLPSLVEIHRNSSLLLVNSHFLTSGSKPLLPNIIEVAGIHCHPPFPLENNLEKFVQSKGSDGFIYFSLGTIVQANSLDPSFVQIFVRVFSKLKQKVIWKWEGGHIENLPKNVKLVKYAPQQDLLGHKNIKLFISHGGLFSVQEALYHGVPMIGFPVGFDQDNNVIHAQNFGWAILMEITELSEEILEKNIKYLLENPTYRKRAEELSRVFKDQIDRPLDRAIWWIEYILRHGGGDLTSSNLRNLSFLQYHSIDVILFLSSSLLLPLWTIKYLFESIRRFFFKNITLKS